MRQFIEEAGYVTTERKDPITIGILGLQKQLRVAGLLNNKHIPDAYFRASKEQRLALLQGLIDTDGHVAGERHGMIEFMSTKLNLAQGVQFLARSLGVKASLSEGRATLNGRDCGPKYRVTFYLEGAARLPRKAMSTCN
jgi:intein/homing endonuclease